MKSNFINNMIIKDVLVDHNYIDISISINDINRFKKEEFSTKNPDVFYKESLKIIKKQYEGDTLQSHIGDISFSPVINKNMLFIVRGHPGSGKTTLGKEISFLNFKHFENDNFFVKDGVYTFDFAHHQTAKDKCFNDTKQALEQGDNVVVTNTFTTLKEIKPFIELAKKNNTQYIVVEMFFNFDNIHNVPANVVNEKKQTFESYEKAFSITKSKHVENFIQIIKEKNSLDEIYSLQPKRFKHLKKG